MAFSEKRGKFGEEFEELILNDLRNRGLKVCWMKNDLKNWNYYLDSQYGDICLNNNIYIDIKRTKQISIKSLMNFRGYYFILGPRDMDLKGTYVIKSKIIKKLYKDFSSPVIMKSGDKGIKIHLGKITKKIKYLKWAENIERILKVNNEQKNISETPCPQC